MQRSIKSTVATVAVALAAAGASAELFAKQAIMTGAGAGTCTDCHSGSSLSYGDLYSHIQSLASKGSSDQTWIDAIKACGTGVFGANGSCTITPPPPTNQAPSISVSNPAAVVEPAAVSFTLTASDPDGDTVTVAASGLPSGASYDDATRTFNWSPSVAGSYTVTFTPTDSQGLAGAAANVKITVDAPTSGGSNDAPVVTKPVDGGSYTATVGTALQIPVAATDKNGDDVALSYSIDGGASTPIASSFDSAESAWTGSFDWTPTAAGTVKVTFTATDDPADATVTSKSASVSVTITVKDPSSGGTGITAVNVSRASWAKRTKTLSAAGTVAAPKGVKVAGKLVTITDTGTGAVIGTAKVSKRKTWSLTKRLKAAPCSITAGIDGLTATRMVDRAPESCSADDDDDGDGDDSSESSDDTSKTTSSTTTTTTDDGTTTKSRKKKRKSRSDD
jgi:hypothetical protein